MVAHPDHLMPTGLTSDTYVSRATLKKLLPNYLLLHSSYADTIARVAITVPPGNSPYKYVGTLCGTRQPDCQRANDAVKASVA